MKYTHFTGHGELAYRLVSLPLYLAETLSADGRFPGFAGSGSMRT